MPHWAFSFKPTTTTDCRFIYRFFLFKWRKMQSLTFHSKPPKRGTSPWGPSNEYSHHMFLCRNMKNYLRIIIKVSLKNPMFCSFKFCIPRVQYSRAWVQWDRGILKGFLHLIESWNHKNFFSRAAIIVVLWRDYGFLSRAKQTASVT